MDERDVAKLFIAEMRALLPIVQRHIDVLSSPLTPEAQRQAAAREITRLSTAMSDLSSEFHAEDCAQLTYAISFVYQDERAARLPSLTLLAATADILTHLQSRVHLMAEESRVLAPSEAERVALNRLLAALRDAQQRVTRDLTLTPPQEQFLAPAASPLDAVPGEHVSGPPHDGAFSSDAASASLEQPSFESVDPAAELQAAIARLSKEEQDLLASFDRGNLLPSRSPYVTAPLPDQAMFGLSTPGAPHLLETLATHPPRVDAPTDGAQTRASSAKNGGASDGQRPFAAPSRLVHPAVAAMDLDVIAPEMRGIFISETTGDVHDLRRTLLRYEQEADADALDEIGRVAHKLKGNAATLSFTVFADLALAFEDILAAVRTLPTDTLTFSDGASALAQGIDLLQAALDSVIAARESDPALVDGARQLRDALLARGERGAPADALSVPRRTPTPTFSPPVAPSVHGANVSQDQSRRQAGSGAPDDQEAVLRVRVSRLDDLMKHVSALALNRAALTRARHDVDHLQGELEHALARLTILSGDIADLHTIIDQVSAFTQHDHDPSRDSDSQATQPGYPRATGDTLPPQPLANGRFPHPAMATAASAFIAASSSPGITRPGLDLERFTELDHALRSLTEVVADVDTTSRTLRGILARLNQVSQEQTGLASDVQRDVMRIRLVPLSELTPRLHFEVRRLRQFTGKTITFTTSGEQTEIDRNISEALTEPLIQLVRNAILHGIEPQAERRDRNKPESGTVWLHAYYTNSDVVIEVGDDGRGVNPTGLAGVALTKGYINAERARSLSPSDALDLMFLPGVSTVDEAQILGGRGIGLDEVRTAIQQLKGTISVRSEPGRGSVFRVRVPISLSIVRSLHVRVADQTFAVPFTSVQRTFALAPGDVITSSAQTLPAESGRVPQWPMRIRVEAQPRGRNTNAYQPASSAEFEEIPAFDLGALLGVEPRGRDSLLALVIEHGNQRVAMLANEVIAEQELVVQVLPRHLQRRMLRGAAVTSDGELLLLLDVYALVASALENASGRPVTQPRANSRPVRTLAPCVLVVDDSVSIRGALERLLTRAGLQVQLARDGIEALELMLVSPPRIVILDIEMPRLDGYELLSIIRGSPQFSDVRVIMLTSRAAEVHREHALSLGAQGYLIKPVPTDVLIDTINTLLAEPALPQ